MIHFLFDFFFIIIIPYCFVISSVVSVNNPAAIIPFENRFEIISSLSCVDEVVVQVHRDKIKQYHDIGFDLLFVGDDWKGSDIFNKVDKELRLFNAKVKYFEYTKNVSSTKFTEILQDIYDTEKIIK